MTSFRSYLASRKLCVVDATPKVVPRSRRLSDLNEQDEDSSVSTIFSLWSYDISSDEESSVGSCCSSSSELDDDSCDDDDDDELSWEHQWSSLQEWFASRDRLLSRMAKTKSSALMNAIRRREALVRKQERELLILQYRDEDKPKQQMKIIFQKKRPTTSKSTQNNAKSNELDLSISVTDSESWDSSVEEDDELTVWFDAKSVTGRVCSDEYFSFDPDSQRSTPVAIEKQSWFSTLRDSVLFEWHTSFPAVCCLAIHSSAHASISDCIEIIAEEFRKYCEMKSETSRISFDHYLVSDILLFCFGLTLLRFSGILYWWLNTDDFHCIKMDYHNRLQLGRWDAKCLMGVKRRPVLQAFLYFIGYLTCFKVVDDLFERSLALFDQRDEILGGLPSLGEHNGLCVAPGTSFFHPSCQDEILRLEEDRLDDFEEDFNYLWRTLYYKSFDAHWGDWAATMAGDLNGGRPPFPLISPSRSVLLCISIALSSIFLLRSYGFPVFSKY